MVLKLCFCFLFFLGRRRGAGGGSQVFVKDSFCSVSWIVWFSKFSCCFSLNVLGSLVGWGGSEVFVVFKV